MSNKIIKTIALVCLPFIGLAQTALYNNNAAFFVNNGAIVQVNGTVINEAGSN